MVGAEDPGRVATRGTETELESFGSCKRATRSGTSRASKKEK